MQFTNPLLLKTVRRIVAESGEGDKCIISKLRVDDTNSVQLPCGHLVHIDYFMSSLKNASRCPYCMKVCGTLNPTPCSVAGCNGQTLIRNGKCKKHNVPMCQHILSKGKNKGSPCSRRCVQGGRCSIHLKHAVDASISA